jgi:membrane protein DedA with SNARE-associated domain
VSGGAPTLPGPLAGLSPLLEHYGYAAVGGLVLLDNCVVPVPGQTVLIAAAVYAGAGRLSLPLVLVIAFVAAVLGNTAGYAIGRAGGRAFAHRHGRYVLLTPDRLATAEEYFRRRGTLVVLFGRFLDVLRQTNGLIAGTVGMGWGRFCVCNVVGAALWTGCWAGVGYAAGEHAGAIYHVVLRFQLLALGLLAALAVVYAVRRVRRHRRGPRSGPGPGPGDTARMGPGDPGRGPEHPGRSSEDR